MKRTIFSLVSFTALLASAQTVTVVEHTQLLKGTEGPAYYPVLNADGSQLLYSTILKPGLKLYDFNDNVSVLLSDQPGIGQDAIFGGDGNVYFVTTQRGDDNLIYRTGHKWDVKNATSEVVLEPQHGAMLPMKTERGAALRAPKRSYNNASDIGTAVYTQG